MSAGMFFSSTTFCRLGRCADADRVAAAEAGHDGTCPVQRLAEIARQRGAVERRRGAKPLGRHHQCELATHTEAGDADGAGGLRQGEQVVAGGEDVVERTAALGQQLAQDAGDAAGHPPRANMFGVMAMYPAAATRREIRSLSGP